MLSGKGNAVERGKTAIGLISKKATLHVQHTCFCTFICFCFARLQLETSGNFLVTRFMEEMSYVFSFTFFHCRSFSHSIGGLILILSPPLHNFRVVLPTKKCLLCFFSLCSKSLSPFLSLSFAGLPPTFSFSLSFSCSIFQICGHDN